MHLAGQKTVVLLPPNATMERSYLMPASHPSARQSQILWSNSSVSRQALGYSSGGKGLQSDAVISQYPKDEELIVDLLPGSVLYIPMGWGHQTFNSGGPSISVAVTTYPAVDPRGKEYSAASLMGEFLGEVRNEFVAAIVDSATSMAPLHVWAGMRRASRLLIITLLGKDETQNFLDAWMQQRWQPLLEAMGVHPDPVPAHFCQKAPEKEPSAGIRKMALALRRLAKDAGPALELLTLRQRIGDLLDMLPRPVVPRIAEGERRLTAAEVLGFLLQSLISCEKAYAAGSGI